MAVVFSKNNPKLLCGTQFLILSNYIQILYRLAGVILFVIFYSLFTFYGSAYTSGKTDKFILEIKLLIYISDTIDKNYIDCHRS